MDYIQSNLKLSVLWYKGEWHPFPSRSLSGCCRIGETQCVSASWRQEGHPAWKLCTKPLVRRIEAFSSTMSYCHPTQQAKYLLVRKFDSYGCSFYCTYMVLIWEHCHHQLVVLYCITFSSCSARTVFGVLKVKLDSPKFYPEENSGVCWSRIFNGQIPFPLPSSAFGQRTKKATDWQLVRSAEMHVIGIKWLS